MMLLLCAVSFYVVLFRFVLLNVVYLICVVSIAVVLFSAFLFCYYFFSLSVRQVRKKRRKVLTRFRYGWIIPGGSSFRSGYSNI